MLYCRNICAMHTGLASGRNFFSFDTKTADQADEEDEKTKPWNRIQIKKYHLF